MDVDAICVERTGNDSAMRRLKLPSNLQRDPRDWMLTDAEFHTKVSREIGNCDKVAPMGARVIENDIIILMPAENVRWDETFAAVKVILAKY